MKTLMLAFMTLAANLAVAASVDLLSFQTPAKNQGDSDHCAFYATTALLESALKISFGKDFDIAESFEVHRSKVLHHQRPEVEFGDTYQLLENFQNDQYVRTEDGRQISFRGFKFQMLTKMWDSRPWSAIIADQLKKRRPVVITLKVAVPHVDDKTGVFVYNDEINENCTAQKIPCGGHAVLLVGYDEERKIFVFKNSWGPAWGKNGYGFASADHINRFSDQPMTGYFDSLVSPVLLD